jgi:hypothetical protein
MRFSNIFGVVVLGLASTSQAAKSWSFEDATVAVAAKGAAEPSKQKWAVHHVLCETHLTDLRTTQAHSRLAVHILRHHSVASKQSQSSPDHH